MQIIEKLVSFILDEKELALKNSEINWNNLIQISRYEIEQVRDLHFSTAWNKNSFQ